MYLIIFMEGYDIFLVKWILKIIKIIVSKIGIESINFYPKNFSIGFSTVNQCNSLNMVGLTSLLYFRYLSIYLDITTLYVLRP